MRNNTYILGRSETSPVLPTLILLRVFLVLLACSMPCTTPGTFTYYLFFSINFSSKDYLPNCTYETNEEQKSVAHDDTVPGIEFKSSP